jgi:hypothetical protein
MGMVDATPILVSAFQLFDFITAGVLSPCSLKSPAARSSIFERWNTKVAFGCAKKNAFRLPGDDPQQLAEQIVLRIAVAQMLPIAFGEWHTTRLASLRAPITHGVQVMIHAMMLSQPVALTGVTGEHLGFGLDHLANIHAKCGRKGPAQGIFPLDGIGVIEVRNSF